MSKLDRTYRDVNTGKSLGTDSFAMVMYAHNNPGCLLESYDPITQTTSQQKFNAVTIEDMLGHPDKKHVICYIERKQNKRKKEVFTIEFSIDNKYLTI